MSRIRRFAMENRRAYYIAGKRLEKTAAREAIAY